MDRIVLLDVQDPQEGFNGTVIGVVEMTTELAKLIFRRAKVAVRLAKEDETFGRLEYFDSSVSYIEDDDDLETEQYAGLVDQVPLFLSVSPFAHDRCQKSTEYNCMAIDGTDVWWRTSARHSEAMATTGPIKLDEIKRFLKED